MKVQQGLPPNIDQIRIYLKDIPLNFVFTYGDTCYIQSNEKFPDHVHAHELIHSKQQGDDPDGWWNRYLIDSEFRLEQELEAYRIQYQWVKQRTKSKFAKDVLFILARDLSNHYGLSISHIEAEAKIRRLQTKDASRVIFSPYGAT